MEKGHPPLKQTVPTEPAPREPVSEEPWVRLRSGTAHPLVFRRMIKAVDRRAEPGDVVAVYDREDRYFGHALFHDRSQIALRMLSYDTVPIDDAFWRGRLERAVAWRHRLIGDIGPQEESMTDAYRLVHAEGDGLSGLVAERYADWIAIELFSIAMHRRIDLIKGILSELTGITNFVVRADNRIQRLEHFTLADGLSDEPPRTIKVTENGVRFHVDLSEGQKTGFFCDQRDNRRHLARLCRGADVLDVCCYTGGFGIYAKTLGGAETVTGVDLDEEAVALARRNANLNEVRVQHVHADAFSYLRQMQQNQRRFDVVVLDPPKFVPAREEMDEGLRKYLDLNTLGMSVVERGGLLLTCSCSGLVTGKVFRETVQAAANRLQRPMQIVERTGAGPDHPVMANCPESEYLKALWVRML